MDGGKTKKTVSLGDIIRLGPSYAPESFVVFSKTETKIKVMPFYNLNISGNNVFQSVSSSADKFKSSFSETKYWKDGDGNISINNSSNLLKYYVTAYEKSLYEKGVEDIIVRIPTYSELFSEGVTNYMRNPGQKGGYWLASCNPNSSDALLVIISDGTQYGSVYYNGSCGIRPIIEIPIE